LTALPPFQALLDEHAADVMAVLRGAVGRTDAEDCFQETFLAALRAYPKLNEASNLRGWLLTIAHRKAIDHHRANGRQPLPIADVDELDAGGGWAEDETSVVGVSLVENGGAESGAWVEDGIWALVGALPPKQRAAVALRYACDMPHAEIAAALGCSPAAARRSLHEGMKRLRDDLGARGSDRERERT
jgi:RNA polymerase sigma factor (sigma-70 family)